MRVAPSCINNCGAEICPLYSAETEARVQQSPFQAPYPEISIQAQQVTIWVKRMTESPDALPMTPQERNYNAEHDNPSPTLQCAINIYEGICRKFGWAKRKPDGVVELRPRLTIVK